MSSALPPIDQKQCPYCAAVPGSPCAHHAAVDVNTAGDEATRQRLRWFIGTGGEDEPGLILIVDHETGIICARSSEVALKHVEALVDAANSAAAVEAELERARLAVKVAEEYGRWASDPFLSTIDVDKALMAWDAARAAAGDAGGAETAEQ